MTFEQMTTEISLLMAQFQDTAEDKPELLVKLHEKLNELRAFGMPVPEDLLQFERDLSRELLDDTGENEPTGPA